MDRFQVNFSRLIYVKLNHVVNMILELSKLGN